MTRLDHGTDAIESYAESASITPELVVESAWAGGPGGPMNESDLYQLLRGTADAAFLRVSCLLGPPSTVRDGPTGHRQCRRSRLRPRVFGP